MPQQTKKGAVTRKEAIDAIREIAAQVGHTPTLKDFRSCSWCSLRSVKKFFGSWNEAVRAAGFSPNPACNRIDDATLLSEWGNVVRTIGRLPNTREYDRHAGHISSTLHRAFGPWKKIPAAFMAFADGKREWADVVEIVDSTAPYVAPARLPREGFFPVFGRAVNFPGLSHEPIDELSVIYLFGLVANSLGYSVESIQKRFPDCIAKRRIGTDRWEQVRIEFEFESRNFLLHEHPVDGCEVIVCWRHNWADCPSTLEVVELEAVVKSLVTVHVDRNVSRENPRRASPPAN